jgi:ferritin-like metal-binding protein YciE
MTGILIQYLNEAHATERALVTTLQTHIAMTPRGAYRRLLERHLRETRGHAEAISARLSELDGSASLMSITVGLAETLIGQALVVAKGPLDLLRGRGGAEKLLKNAKDECATEALEIATYDAIETLADALGDPQTARMAATHRADEERMLAALRELIPDLARAALGVREGDEDSQPRPIANYDQLNSGQIVARLSDLSQRDLQAVADYERAHRNRRTVIERIDALSGEQPWPGYDDEDAAAIVERLDESIASAVRDYESRHRRRVAVLEAAQREISRP